MKEIFLRDNNLDEVAHEAAGVLASGGVIVYPTETAYGLGADYFNEEAVKKIFLIKQREADKPLPVIVSDWAIAEQLVIFDDQIRQILAQHWPGPLTAVLPFRLFGQKSYFPETLGLRISSHIFCQKLALLVKNPIISTSANISGSGALYSMEQIKEQFSQLNIQPDLLINAGNLPLTPATTVIRSLAGKIEVLRQGKINIYPVK
jgi:L-threonylcarbamoyladenylate synthase